MTPGEFAIIEEAYIEKQKQDEEDRITLAYMTALWAAQWFSKKPPKSLREILGRTKPKKQMTDEQIFNVVKALNLALGGE